MNPVVVGLLAEEISMKEVLKSVVHEKYSLSNIWNQNAR